MKIKRKINFLFYFFIYDIKTFEANCEVDEAKKNKF